MVESLSFTTEVQDVLNAAQEMRAYQRCGDWAEGYLDAAIDVYDQAVDRLLATLPEAEDWLRQ